MQLGAKKIIENSPPLAFSPYFELAKVPYELQSAAELNL